MEQQDINTFNDLVLEKERKLEALSEIEEENNSEEFQSVLKVLIENEKKRQEKILEEQRKIEEEERKKKLELERKKQEEILKRQKIIEEARKKEIEKRTKQLLEQQQNSVLQKKEKTVSFETIKDITDKKEIIEEKTEENNDDNKKYKLNLNDLKEESYEVNTPIAKNKIDIEKELFEEFKKTPQEEKKDSNIDILDKLEEKISDNKFPDMSIDEYMKNFDTKDIDNVNNLFEDDDVFPSIPM